MTSVTSPRSTCLLGASQDAVCLYGAPVLAIALAALGPLWPAPMPAVLAAFAVFPGLAHILSSGAVYLDPDCRSIFRRRAVAFYFGPCVALGFGAALAVMQPSWLYTALLLAAVFHNTRQSTGILNLTRRLAGVPAALRPIEERLVWAGNAFCLAFMASPLLPSTLLQVARLVTAVGLVASVGHYLQAGRPRRSAREHLGFLFISATLSWPLVAVKEPLAAWALMTLPHQAQYLGIFWTSQSRRLAAGAARRAAPVLRRMARDGLFGVAFLGALSAVVRFLEASGPDLLRQTVVALVMGCTLAHYWIDAFLWRGRDPGVRSLLLAYIAPRQQQATT